MAYERLNLQPYSEWKAEHVSHLEDGISAALIPENQGELAETEDILKNSEAFWEPGFVQYPPVFDPASMGKVTHIGKEGVKTVNYMSSPFIRFNTNNGYQIKLNHKTHFFRQFYILNASGGRLFSAGNNDMKELEGQTFKLFGGGITATNFNALLGSEEGLQYCPTLIKTWKDSKDLFFNSDIIKELNDLYIYMNDTSAVPPTYVPGETVYVYFTLATPARPAADASQEEHDLWFLNQIPTVKCYESVYNNIYELTSLAILNEKANKYYKSKLLNNIITEIGEWHKSLGISKEVTKTTKNTTTYSELMVENFYPEEYHGMYINGGFNIASFDPLEYKAIQKYTGYKITQPMPIDLSVEGAVHASTGVLRHYAFLTQDGILLKRLENGGGANKTITFDESYFNSIDVDPSAVKWFVVSNSGANLSSFKFTVTITKATTTYELPNLRLTDDQSAGGGGGGTNTGASNLVTLSNVDRIVAIGDSYTESHYTIKDKAWVSKVSLLSDYNYDNFAISGDTYRGQLNKIRTGTYAYAKETGMTWEELHPTHAIMISKTNDTKYMNTQQFIYDMIATIETTKGLGAIPIVCTEYHVSGHDHVQTAFDYYAKKYGGYYIDLTTKDYNLRGSDYAPFWGGSHPGTRSNHLFVDPIVDYVNKYLPRPYSAIKIFRARDNSQLANLDAYLFNTIEERAEKFKEISICHSALKNSALYDNCTNQPNGKVESEYFKLMKNMPVKFENICLIDVILPTTVHDITEVELITNELEGVNCYVKDVMAEPYPSPAFCRRFDIPGILDASQVAVGNTYTSNKTTGATYKVVEIIYDQVESDSGFVDGTILICSGNKSTAAYNSSTLTLVSGTGASTLNCTYEAVGLSSDYPAGKQDIGHYVQLETFGVVSDSVLRRAVDYDKITFLLVGDSEFSLKNVEVKFKGNITKTRTTPNFQNSVLPYWDEYTPLNKNPKFDDSNIQYWLNKNLSACGLTPTTVADKCLPIGISKIVTLTPENGVVVQSFETSKPGVTRNLNRKVRVWARYFPDIFDSNTMVYPDEAPINDDSFDYAKLGVHLYDTTSNIKNNVSVEMQKLIGLHWTEVDVDLTLPPVNKTWYIGLEALDKPIQLAYCDVI